MPNKTSDTLGTTIIFAAIALLTVLDMGTGRIQPCIYYVYADWRPVGEVHLLLDMYVLYSTKGVTHMLGCSLGVITKMIINTMMNLLTIILGLL